MSKAANKDLSKILKDKMGYSIPDGKRCDGCKFFRLIDGVIEPATRTWEGRCDYWTTTTPSLGEMNVEEHASCDYWKAKA